MSTLFVNNLNTASGTTITVPTGKKLVAPGHVLNVQSVTMTDNTTFAGTAFTDIDDGVNPLSITMTPTSTSSIIRATIQGQFRNNAALQPIPINQLVEYHDHS